VWAYTGLVWTLWGFFHPREKGAPPPAIAIGGWGSDPRTWQFVALWVAAALLAQAVGIGFGRVTGAMSGGGFGLYLSLGLRGAITGALVGLGQWVVFSRARTVSARWILLTACAYLVSTPAGIGAHSLLRQMSEANPAFPILVAAASGALIGAAQWIILRRLVAQAEWWIAACALASVLSFVARRPTTQLLGLGWTIGFGTVESGLIHGLVTGIALSLLYRRAAASPQTSPPSPGP
jgi:hypothetical protein